MVSLHVDGIDSVYEKDYPECLMSENAAPPEDVGVSLDISILLR